MPVSVSVISEQDRMELYFSGNLDVSVWRCICEVCDTAPAGLKACVLDLTGVEHVFDSGVALLRILCRRLRRLGASVSIRGDLSKITERYPLAVAVG